MHSAVSLCSAAYRAVLLGYSGICALWMPLVLWLMPNDSFKVGMVYLFRPDWRFEMRQRSGREMRCLLSQWYALPI